MSLLESWLVAFFKKEMPNYFKKISDNKNQGRIGTKTGVERNPHH